MLRNRTTFVVGAGASNEVEMPLGAELKKQIANLMRVESNDWGELKYSEENLPIFREIECLGQFKKDKRRIVAAARQLSTGVVFASSIDNFLEIRKDNPDIALLAKAALVHLILKGERASDLTTEGAGNGFTLKPTAIDGTWYQEFAQFFFEKVGVGDIEKALSRLSVIDFNYDRCFEQVLFHAFTGLYNLPRERASELMATVQILHPYGSVGTLHNPRKDLPASEFGSDPTGAYLHLSKGIRTFAEQMADTNLLGAMRGEIEAADTIVFLGCAFHAQNMELMRLSPPLPKTIFGTTHGMSEVDNAYVEARLQTMFSGRGGQPEIKMVPLRCGEFLKQFRRTLSAD